VLGDTRRLRAGDRQRLAAKARQRGAVLVATSQWPVTAGCGHAGCRSGSPAGAAWPTGAAGHRFCCRGRSGLSPSSAGPTPPRRSGASRLRASAERDRPHPSTGWARRTGHEPATGDTAPVTTPTAAEETELVDPTDAVPTECRLCDQPLLLRRPGRDTCARHPEVRDHVVGLSPA
jgi:hypothetical protein